jgi:hypothetical protein
MVYGENGDGGGVSERSSSIPWTGMMREAPRSSWARWWSSGRRVTAGKSGDCEARVLVWSSQR